VLVMGGCGENIIPPPVEYGPEWVVYTRTNSPLISDSIFTITTHSSDIWVGTNYGVDKISGDSWQYIVDDLKGALHISEQRVNAITFDTKGAIWFGLSSNGILYYNTFSSKDQWVYITVPQLTDSYVHSIASVDQGDIWIGTGSGVTKFGYQSSNEVTEGRWWSYNDHNSPIPDEPIESVGYDPYHNLVWFGTSTLGVISYNSDLDWNISIPTDNPLPILSMSFPNDKDIWIGTFADWSYRYSVDTEIWTHIGSPESGGGLPSHIVNAVVNNGMSVYFGTDNGLAELTSGEWTVFNIGNSPLPTNTVFCLELDRKGNLWIGTTGGLVKYRKGGTIP